MNEITIENGDKGTEVIAFRHQLDTMAGQFKAALPAHIPLERFVRVVMTAVQQTPDLLRANRRSLWNAAIRAAQDGLLPDGREGAMVMFKDQVQWMPMIAGLRKKVRNSGEIATWDAYVVHANDDFDYELGDTPFIRHKPILDGDPGPVIAAYSVATLKSGEKSREVMSVAAIEKVRKVSRASDSKYGPWVNWYEEMCRKTVARRHAKVLPMSTDLDDLVRRDDELYDFAGARGEAEALQPKTLASKLDMLADTSAADGNGKGEGKDAADAEEEAPSESEVPADEVAGLTDDEKDALRGLAEELANFNTPDNVRRAADGFLRDLGVEDGPLADAAAKVKQIYVKRSNGKMTIEEAKETAEKEISE